MSAALPQAAWWHQNELTPDIHHPLPGKVMCGAVNNAFQLKKPLNLNATIWVIGMMPKKERHKAAEEGKITLHFLTPGGAHSAALVLDSGWLG